MEKGLIFTYVLTYGGSVASLFNPYVGLMIYFCFAIITPEAMWWWAVPRGHYSRTIAIALLVGWAGHNFGDLKFRGAKPVIYSIIGFWGWAVLSTQFAIYKEVSMQFVEAFAKILLPIVVGISLIDSVKKLKQLAWVLMLSQAYVAFELNLSYYNGFNRVTVDFGYAGLDNNSLCIAMVAGSGLAFFMGLNEKKLWRQWLCFISAGLMAHVPMFGDSRGGMLGLVVTGVVSFFLIPKQPKHYFAFGLAVVIGLRLAGPQVVERFLTIFVEKDERDKSAQSRIEMWKDCWELMNRHPLLGIGPDNWPHVAEEFGWKRGKEAHSLWFQIGAEMGFVGLGFLMSYYGLAVWHLWWLTRPPTRGDPWLADVGRMVIASIIGFGCSASFVSLEGLELPYYVTLLGAGALKLATDKRVSLETVIARKRLEYASMQGAATISSPSAQGNN